MLIYINGNVYEGDRQYADAILKVAKEKYKKERSNAIYGVEKNGMLEMKRETFLSSKLMQEKSAEYRKVGFKVHSVSR